MVEHHVQDDLDPGLVEGLDHVLELPHLSSLERVPDGITALGGVKEDRAVAPVIPVVSRR